MAAADDDSSDLSSLSSLSPAPSDDEMDAGADAAKPKGRKSGILKFFPKLSEQAPKEPSPPPRKRSPSPPHEYVLADNPDIAVRVGLHFLPSFVCMRRVGRGLSRRPLSATRNLARQRHERVPVADAPLFLQFIVMFRNRFNDAFPKSLAHFGPQELERDIVESIPGDRVEHFLCAVLGLLLNRKQDVKYATRWFGTEGPHG